MADNTTYEKDAAVKNGVKRLVFIGLGVLLEILVIMGTVWWVAEYAEWIAIVQRFLAAIVVLLIYNHGSSADMKMPWIMLIMAMPVMGVTTYLLIGMDGSTRKMRERYQKIDNQLLPLLKQSEEVQQAVEECNPGAAGVCTYLRENAGFPVYGHTKITYYDDALKGLEAQKEDLEKAEQFIFMEYHAIEDSRAWRGIEDILVRKAKEGVEVRVFYDDMGSIGFVDTDFAKKLSAKGISCRVFNQLTWGLNIFLNNRDHRKITVIDGKVGFTGGYNLADEYFHMKEAYGFWKDTGIRMEGDAVRSLTVLFLEMWNAIHEDEEDMQRAADYLHMEEAEEAKRPSETLQKPTEEAAGQPSKTGQEQTAEEAADAGRPQKAFGYVQPYADSPMNGLRVGEDVYISLIEQARRYVWFITPYLIITEDMIRAMGLAAMRGVDVRVITPGVPDKKMVYQLTRSYYHSLAEHGVRVYEYTPGFCHAKMCLSDDRVATCGTINLDYRSLYHHFENGCLFMNCDAVQDMRADFEATMKECREVTEEYRDGRGALLKISQLILRLFAPLM